TITTRVSSGQLAACQRPGSVHVRSTAYTRPSLSIDTAPGPWASATNTYSLLFTSSLRIESVCSWAKRMPPSGVPTMPSAVLKSAQTSSQLAPAAMTPGISVTVAARSPGSSCCAEADVERAPARATAATKSVDL